MRLRGLVKTLNDVVVPAIPADDPLALQELKMVVRYLGFARERVDHLYARARYELTFYSDLAARLAELLGKSHAGQAKDAHGFARSRRAPARRAGRSHRRPPEPEPRDDEPDQRTSRGGERRGDSRQTRACRRSQRQRKLPPSTDRGTRH
jgi:hypothetical protein